MEEKPDNDNTLSNVPLPKGTKIIFHDDEGDAGELIADLLEFISSPVFAEKILPEFGEHLRRKHKEVSDRISNEKESMILKAKFNTQFLWARVITVILLVTAVAVLTVYGKIETETTIVTMMATLGIIIWGGKE